jgi:hypothetical protein
LIFSSLETFEELGIIFDLKELIRIIRYTVGWSGSIGARARILKSVASFFLALCVCEKSGFFLSLSEALNYF